MTKKLEDIIIVGGGPAGLQTARFLLENKYPGKIMIYEEHPKPGLPQHCAGLISIKGLEGDVRIKSWRKNLSLNVIKGAEIFSPGGIVLNIQRKEPVAAVVDRVFLEELLAEKVLSLGAEINFSSKITAVAKDGVLLDGKKIKGEYTIVASGIKRPSILNLDLSEIRGKLPALQFDIRISKNIDLNYVKIFIGERYSKDFFTWIIPIDDKIVRIGLASKSNTLAKLKYILEKDKIINSLIGEYSVLRVMGGAVITGGYVEKMVDGTVALVGDSAGQTKPTTGGGIVYLSMASKILSDAIIEGDIYRYEYVWSRRMGREIRFQKAFRRILYKLSDEELDEVFLIAKKEGIEDIVSREGDMDFQRSIIVKAGLRTLLRYPRLFVEFLWGYFT